MRGGGGCPRDSCGSCMIRPITSADVGKKEEEGKVSGRPAALDRPFLFREGKEKRKRRRTTKNGQPCSIRPVAITGKPFLHVLLLPPRRGRLASPFLFLVTELSVQKRGSGCLFLAVPQFKNKRKNEKKILTNFKFLLSPDFTTHGFRVHMII